MNLRGEDIGSLRDALVEAFPTFGDMEQMVRIVHGKNLNEIATDRSVRRAAFDLIVWAITNRQVEVLLNGAPRENTGNETLAGVCTRLLAAKDADEDNPP